MQVAISFLTIIYLFTSIRLITITIMFQLCKDLCKSKKDKNRSHKEGKKDKHGAGGPKEDVKAKHKVKNIYQSSIIG